MKKLAALMLSAFLCVSMMAALPLSEPITADFEPAPIVTGSLSEPVESGETICAMDEVPDHIDGEN